MPLPKIPTKPATLLVPKEYPKAAKRNAVKTGKTTSKQTQAPAAKPAVKPAAKPTSKAAPKATTPALKSNKAQTLLSDTPAPSTSKPAHMRLKSSARRSAANTGMTKLFVLDTNVLMHDPTSLFRFEEHDIFLPMSTLEELDGHKRGMSDVARNARQVSRTLDSLVEGIDENAIENGIPLSKLGNKEAKGNLFFQTKLNNVTLPAGLTSGKIDNQILGIVRALADEQPGRLIVLVSKDINMRIKARAMGLPAEDYFNDQVLEDTDLLYSGVMALPDDFWDTHGKSMESWQEVRNGVNRTYY
ncbi:MAG: PIN domain-containing protein, partial [Burkholderiaceae bacterium]|nr:PIN domain-containing protein [Burkholderiaceae bacterium]